MGGIKMMRIRCFSGRAVRRVALLLAIVLGPGTTLPAQEINAALTGTVSDAQGALMPGVTVTVTAGLKETESNQSTLAQTMENKRVSELPLNGRQVYMLLQQTAGTLFTQIQFGASGFSGTRAWDTNGNISI